MYIQNYRVRSDHKLLYVIFLLVIYLALCSTAFLFPKLGSGSTRSRRVFNQLEEDGRNLAGSERELGIKKYPYRSYETSNVNFVYCILC